MHSFFEKTISKNAKTNYTYSKKGRNIFFTKKYKKFLHRCLSCKN